MKKSNSPVKRIIFAVLMALLTIIIFLTLQFFINFYKFMISGEKSLQSLVALSNEQSDDGNQYFDSYVEVGKKRSGLLAETYSGIDFASMGEREIRAEEENLAELVDDINARQLFIIDPNRNVVISSSPELEGQKIDDIYQKEYEKARQEINYFEAKIKNSEYIISVGDNAQNFENAFLELYDPGNTLGDMDANGRQFSFAVDKNDNSFILYERNGKNLTGKNVFDYGITKESLKENFSGILFIDGTLCFANSAPVENTLEPNTQYFVATDILASNDMHAIIWVIVVFVIMAALLVICEILYAPKCKTKKGLLSHLIVPAIVGLILIIVISMMASTLDAISDAFGQTDFLTSQMMERINNSTISSQAIEDYSRNNNVEFARLKGCVIEGQESGIEENSQIRFYYDENRNPIVDNYGNIRIAYANSALLKSMANDENLKEIQIIDRDGYTIASSNDNWYYRVGDDPNAKELYDCLDQKTSGYFKEETLENGNTETITASHMYIFSYTSEYGETRYTSWREYRKQFYEGYDGPEIVMQNGMIIIKSEKPTYKYYNDDLRKAYIYKASKAAVDAEITYVAKTEDGTDKELPANGYTKFIKENYVRKLYRVNQVNKGTGIIEYRIDTRELYKGRGIYSIGVTIASAICFLIIILVLSKKKNLGYIDIDEDEEDEDIKIIRVNGKLVERGRYKKFKERNASEKMAFFYRMSMLALSVGLAIILIYARGEGTIEKALHYILVGGWDRGVNFFSVTACVAVIFIAFTVTLLLRELSMIMSTVMSSYGAAKMSLVFTLLSTAAFVVGILWCLYLLGLDIKGLFASAGIMAAVIGFGCKDAINDIILGITNIMSDKIRRGEVINVKGFVGKVKTINLRSIKLEDKDGNIKMINNNALSEMVNLSRKKPGMENEILEHSSEYKDIK